MTSSQFAQFVIETLENVFYNREIDKIYRTIFDECTKKGLERPNNKDVIEIKELFERMCLRIEREFAVSHNFERLEKELEELEKLNQTNDEVYHSLKAEHLVVNEELNSMGVRSIPFACALEISKLFKKIYAIANVEYTNYKDEEASQIQDFYENKLSSNF